MDEVEALEEANSVGRLGMLFWCGLFVRLGGNVVTAIRDAGLREPLEACFSGSLLFSSIVHEGYFVYRRGSF